MHITTIVLCTADRRYAESFAKAVTSFSEGSLRTKIFSDAGNPAEFADEAEVPDLILMESQMYRTFCRCDKGTELKDSAQTIRNAEAVYKNRICILTEDSEKEQIEWNSEVIPKIYKYRDMETILYDIRRILDQREAAAVANANQGEQPAYGVNHGEQSANNTNGTEQSVDESMCSLIGFYSPIRRTGQSTYARKLAAEAGKNIPVLYINLDSYDGDAGIERDTLADLLYYLHQEDMVFQRVVQKIVWQEENYHQIFPMPLPLDLWDTPEKQWTELFLALKEKSIYKKIFLDFGDGSVDGLFHLLELCDVIYMPVEDDAAALHKLGQYERTLTVSGKQEILAKTRRVYLRSHGEEAELERAVI